nr:class I SAM-dependent methyltransferase [Phyllobacterium sp. SYP-B3895]
MVATDIDAFVTELGGSGRVLEIGSGGGRDALELEKRGISVWRTDISKGFVELLRESGFQADLWTRSPKIWPTRSVLARRTTGSGPVPA